MYHKRKADSVAVGSAGSVRAILELALQLVLVVFCVCSRINLAVELLVGNEVSQ